MAEVQTSGPLVGDPLTDETWRGILGDEPAIVQDTDGSAFGITLPPASNSVEIGSATIDSLARVGGFLHRIPAGTTQSLEIPASTNASVGRTDLIVSRLDASAYATEPGPVRLYRIPGVEGSAARPAYDAGPPGQEDLPHWAITRKSGQALTQATVVDLRARTGPHLYAQPGLSPFPSMPLGSTASRDGIDWSRELASNGSAVWVERWRETEVLTGTAATASGGDAGWQRHSAARLVRLGNLRWLHMVSHRSGAGIASNSRGNIPDQKLATLHGVDDPPSGVAVTCSGRVLVSGATGGSYAASGHITASGDVYLNWMAPDITIGPATDDTVRLDAFWFHL